MKGGFRNSSFACLASAAVFMPDSSVACDRHCYETVTTSDGTEISVWEDVQDGKPVICSSTFGDKQDDVLSIVLPNGETQNPVDPQIIADRNGNVIVAWKANDPRIKKNVLFIAYRLQDGTWNKPFPVSELEESVENSFTLKINGSGTISLVWTSFLLDETSPIVRAATGTLSTGFTMPRTISL